MYKTILTPYIKAIFGLLLTLSVDQNIYAKRNSFGQTKSYQKKRAYEGLGKKSKVTSLPKTKITNGHGKRTKKGYTYVNPYARS